MLNTRSSNTPVLIKYDGEFHFLYRMFPTNIFQVAKILIWNSLLDQVPQLMGHAQPLSMANFMFLVDSKASPDRFLVIYVIENLINGSDKQSKWMFS